MYIIYIYFKSLVLYVNTAEHSDPLASCKHSYCYPEQYPSFKGCPRLLELNSFKRGKLHRDTQQGPLLPTSSSLWPLTRGRERRR